MARPPGVERSFGHPAWGNAGVTSGGGRLVSHGVPARQCKDPNCPRKHAGKRCQTRRRLSGAPWCRGDFCTAPPRGMVEGCAATSAQRKQEKQRVQRQDADFDMFVAPQHTDDTINDMREKINELETAVETMKRRELERRRESDDDAGILRAAAHPKSRWDSRGWGATSARWGSLLLGDPPSSGGPLLSIHPPSSILRGHGASIT